MGSKSSKRKLDKKVDNITELTEDDIQFLLKSTRYNHEEIKVWHAGFIKDCPTGKLDKKTFIEIYKKFYKDGKSDKFCGYVFKAFDLNNSGEIDFVEFLIAVSIISQGTLKEKLRMSFNLFDIDKDGRIDAKELESLILAIYDLVEEKNRKGANAPPERVKHIMAKLDKNHDGKISIDEFINGCINDENLRKFLAPTTTTS